MRCTRSWQNASICTWLTATLSKNMRMRTKRPNKLKTNQNPDPVTLFAETYCCHGASLFMPRRRDEITL